MVLEFPSLFSGAKYLNKRASPIRSSQVTSSQKQSSPGIIALGITTRAPQTHPGQQPKAHSSAAVEEPAIVRSRLKSRSPSESGQQQGAESQSPSSQERPSGKMLAGQPGIGGVVSCPSD